MLLGNKDFLRLGDWNAICDVCGFKYKASELRRRWDGFMVCPSDYEERHPQDLIKSVPDRQAAPWVRSEVIPIDWSLYVTVKFDPQKLFSHGGSASFNTGDVVLVSFNNVPTYYMRSNTVTVYPSITISIFQQFIAFGLNQGVGSTLPFVYLGAV